MARVLIVEDMPLIAFELKDTLEDLGHHVVGIAASVDGVLGRLAATDPAPDFVVLDVDLRGGRQRRWHPMRQRAIPFVVTSGYGKEMLDEIVVDEPRLSKPISDQKLKDAISGLLRDRPA